MIYTNGSSFNEKYVGVGQARVKELFNKANSYEKCIIFIDEIDTLGRKRSDKGDHSEFDNTLNSLLAEMDGMNENKNILVIGATNNSKEAMNIISYIQTKFFHFTLTLKKNTQHATKGAYEFVPIQNFDESWTDKKLYKKYNLTNDEIDYIETMIRPMEINK